MSFKDDYQDVQHLVREVAVLRKHNVSGKKDNQYLLFSEAAVTCILLERFLRIIPVMVSTEEDTLSQLLQRALLSKKIGFLTIADAEKVIPINSGIRNGLLHGNFEQLAKKHNVTKNDYFKLGFFQRDIDVVYSLLDKLFMSIDSNTGMPIRLMNNSSLETIGIMVRLTNIQLDNNQLIGDFIVMLPTRPEQFAPSDPNDLNLKVEYHKNVNYFQSLVDSPTKEQDIMSIGHQVAKIAIQHQAEADGKNFTGTSGNITYDMEVRVYLPNK